MCTDLGPDLQQAQHAAMLPGLMAVMDDFNAPRVQVRTPSRNLDFFHEKLHSLLKWHV